ncbi:MAG: Na+/H+ antiporter subunit B [Candidatus Hydrogenedentota bacterium]
MTSRILYAWAPTLGPLMIVFSIALLLRGHNAPGGGFVGGLVAGCGFVLHAVVMGHQRTRALLRVTPQQLIGAGLALAVLSGITAFLAGKPLLTGLWMTLSVPMLGAVSLGTPLLFDVGVYLLVLGMSAMLALAMLEDEDVA